MFTGDETGVMKAVEGDRKRQHADDEHDGFPVDRAVGAGKIDAPEQTHQQTPDQRGLHVRDEAADHQPDDERQAEKRLRRLVGGRRHFVDLGGNLDDDQIPPVRPKSLDIRPGTDQQQGVAELQRFVQRHARVRDDATSQADHRQPKTGSARSRQASSCR